MIVDSEKIKKLKSYNESFKEIFKTAASLKMIISEGNFCGYLSNIHLLSENTDPKLLMHLVKECKINDLKKVLSISEDCLDGINKKSTMKNLGLRIPNKKEEESSLEYDEKKFLNKTLGESLAFETNVEEMGRIFLSTKKKERFFFEDMKGKNDERYLFEMKFRNVHFLNSMDIFDSLFSLNHIFSLFFLIETYVNSSMENDEMYLNLCFINLILCC